MTQRDLHNESDNKIRFLYIHKSETTNHMLITDVAVIIVNLNTVIETNGGYEELYCQVINIRSNE